MNTLDWAGAHAFFLRRESGASMQSVLLLLTAICVLPVAQHKTYSRAFLCQSIMGPLNMQSKLAAAELACGQPAEQGVEATPVQTESCPLLVPCVLLPTSYSRSEAKRLTRQRSAASLVR